MSESVSVGLGDDQANTLSGLFELLVMVHPASAAILNVKDGIVVHVAHLMQKCCDCVFYISVQRSRSDIDFVTGFFSVNCPDGRNAVVSVSLGSALDCDNRHLKLIFKEISVQESEELFKLSSKAGYPCNFFHGV